MLSRKGAFYGTSKRCSERIIEQYHEEFGLAYTILRYGSVYGDRADETNRIHRMLRQALIEGRIVFPGDGSEEREYIHAEDAARAQRRRARARVPEPELHPDRRGALLVSPAPRADPRVSWAAA